MADIRYNFVATGQGDVLSAFRGIEQAAERSARAGTTRERVSRSAASAEERRYREAEKYAAKIARELEREATQAERTAKRAADVQAREAKRAADAKVREAERAARAVEKAAAAEAREAKRSAAQQARDAERSARERQKAQEHVYDVRQRYLADQRKAGDARVAKFDRGLSAAKDIALSATTGVVGAGLGIVGGAAREGMRLQDASTRLAVSARGAGEKGVDANILRREFENAALENTGVKAADLAEGAQSFVAKTGDLAAARRFSSTFGTVASATGSSVQDIAGAAADIFQKFDIKGIEEMRDALAALTFQGKQGAFELKDAVSQFARISAAAERFGVSKGAAGLKTLGGLTQIARTATGSPEQAATAVEAIFRQLVAKATSLKGAGVDVFEKGSTSKTRDIRDVLVDTISKNKGSLPALQKVFDSEGIRGVSPLISTYNQAHDAAAGTEEQKTAAGVQALRDALAKAIDAPGNWSEVVKDAASAQQTASAQLEGAWEALKARVSEQAVPALSRLIPKLTQLAENIDPIITVFEALVTSAELVVDVFKTLGLIKGKTESPAEKYAAAQKEYDAKIAKGLVPTAADAAKLAEARAGVYQDVDVAGGQHLKSMTPEAFAKRYADLGSDTTPEDKKNTEQAAIDFAKRFKRGESNPFLDTNDTLRSFFGETAAQRDLRTQFQGDATYDRDHGGGQNGGGGKGKTPGLDTAKLQTQIDGLASNLAGLGKAVQAASDAKSPSVFSGR